MLIRRRTTNPSLCPVRILSPIAENLGLKSGDLCVVIFASEGFRSRLSEGRRNPGREPSGASFLILEGRIVLQYPLYQRWLTNIF